MESSSLPDTKGLKLVGTKWFIITDAKITGYCQIGPFDDVREAQMLRDCIVQRLKITRASQIYQEHVLVGTLAHTFCQKFDIPVLVGMIKEKKLYAAYNSYVLKGKSAAITPPKGKNAAITPPKGKNAATTQPPADKGFVTLVDETEDEKENTLPVKKRGFLTKKEKELGAGKTAEDRVLVKGLLKKLQQQVEIAERAVRNLKNIGNTISTLLANDADESE